MANYYEHALDGASPVDLVVALYDGMIRFLYAAIAAVERDDVQARRAAVKRALAILIHLQARLRMDIGGRPAQVLSEFYASMFALILQASLAASKERFEEAIGCIRNVRDAWKQVASDPTVSSTGQAAAGGRSDMPAQPSLSRQIAAKMVPPSGESATASRWTA